MQRNFPALFLHGGAGSPAPKDRCEKIRLKLRAFCETGFEYLKSHSALETVLHVVQRLEDDPLFNAGTGSVLQQDGKARMSASVMDGHHGRFAGVINIEKIRNPIRVAQALLTKPDRILAGPEATRFARSLGFRSWNPITQERRNQWHNHLKETLPGTVGVVAVDRHSHLAAATSSGGKLGAAPGRVSDSALPAGNYANAQAAVSCSGLGEDIVEEALAVRLVQQASEETSLEETFFSAFKPLARRNRRVAAIGLDSNGVLAWGTTLPWLYAVGQSGRRHLETF
jgi:L-asparaginase